MNRALVTGCAGFIGSHLTQRLLEDGYSVIGIDGLIDNYDVAMKRRNLELIGSHKEFHFHECLLQQGDWPHWLENVEVVFHLAAMPGVRSSWGSMFTEYVNHNVLATQQLLDACLQHNTIKKVIVSSSSSVYGTMRQHFTKESAPIFPLSPYGVTKAAMEQLCQVYVAAHQLPVVNLRYFTVYGPRQRPDMAFHRFYRQMMRGEPLLIFGDGKQTRDFTYVTDAVNANLLAAEKGEPGDVFNIGGNREVSLLEVVDIMAQIFGQKPILSFMTAQTGDSERTCADITYAKEKLGYSPQVTLEQGLQLQLTDLVEYYRE